MQWRSWIPCLLALPLLALLGCGAGPRPLEVTFLPPDPMPAPGSTVAFRVAAESSLPVSYRWMKDGERIPGATEAVYLLLRVSPLDRGAYQVEVSDGETAITTDPFVLEPVDHAWVVRSDADSGPDTLRDILARVDGLPGRLGIHFLLGEAPTIHLRSGLPPIHSDITILGPPGLTLDGGDACRPFFLDGGTLLLDNFTVAHGLAKGGNAPGGGGGAAGLGGAIFQNRGALILRRMVFLANRAVGGDSAPGGDGENGGGGGFGGDAPGAGGGGGPGGFLLGLGGTGYLDGSNGGGGPAHGGEGAGGGACRGGPLDLPLATWFDNLPGGDASWGGGGGFSVGPEGGGGGGSSFGGGGGGSGGLIPGLAFAGAGQGEGGIFGGSGGLGDGLLVPGTGGGGGGCGGAIFLRRGTLDMARCRFAGNRALRGRGFEDGLGKGGALFIYPYAPATGPFDAANLLQQAYEGNEASDAGVVEDRAFDNEDFYIAHAILALGRAPELEQRYRQYRQARRLGLLR